MAKPLDIEGQRFGRLTVISLIPEELRKNSYKRREWLCKCDCGNEIIVEQRSLTGKKYSQQSCGCLREVMHLIATSKFNLNFDYVNQFENFKKYAFLHKAVVHLSKIKASEELYKNFIEKFYYEKQFNAIYNFWLLNENRGKTFYDWAKPSVDHIIPRSRGGKEEVNNYQFLTTFENLNKRDMTNEEWIEFKKITNTTSDFYIENILKDRGGKE